MCRAQYDLIIAYSKEENAIVESANQLRPFNYDPERTRPVDLARQTAQEFLIGDILAHRGDRNHRSTMEFLVRWEDFTQACREIA